MWGEKLYTTYVQYFCSTIICSLYICTHTYMYSWLRVIVIYVLSGIGGFLVSGIFDATSISVSECPVLGCVYIPLICEL